MHLRQYDFEKTATLLLLIISSTRSWTLPISSGVNVGLEKVDPI